MIKKYTSSHQHNSLAASGVILRVQKCEYIPKLASLTQDKKPKSKLQLWVLVASHSNCNIGSSTLDLCIQRMLCDGQCWTIQSLQFIQYNIQYTQRIQYSQFPFIFSFSLQYNIYNPINPIYTIQYNI